MKKTIPLALLFCMVAGFNISADSREVRRFGLFVGANNGGGERKTLQYADDDARSMNRTMEDIGGIDSRDSLLLIDPTANEIREALKSLKEQINGVENLVRRTEIMFYYSGHSDEQGLMLSDEKLSYKTIRNDLDQSGANVVIAVLDSCSSGAFTRAKGGSRQSPFLVDDSSSMEGHAFLTSSSETELSQESDRIEGSFFTHFLVTGLRGAADNTRDGRVSLNEVYEHTFQETLASTESTLGGPQHPAYEIQLTGTGDLVLTDLTIPTSALQISGELSGRFAIRNERDKLVAEFSQYGGDTFKLALPAGEYTVLVGNDDEVRSARVTLNQGGQYFLTQRDFTRKFLEFTRFRGDSDRSEEELDEVPFCFSLLPGINFPSIDDNSLVRIQLGSAGYVPHLAGVQFNYLFNITGESGEGVQGSSIFNIAGGSFMGVQGAGVFNISSSGMRGVQGAGIFNIAGRPSAGVQGAGIFNIAGEMKGVQGAGIFNYTSYIEGAQASLVNIAGTVNGLQVGLVNISRELDGVAIGLINLSRNGIVDGGLWYEYSGQERVYAFFQSGNEHFYTLFFVGNSTDNLLNSSENLVWGGHIGSRMNWGPFEIDLDFGTKASFADIQAGYDRSGFIPSGRAVVALQGLGLFWGVNGVLKSPMRSESSLFTGESWDFDEKGEYKFYKNFLVGVRF
jgi:hypothetical protein